MLAFVFLPAILGTCHYLVFVPLINTVLLSAPMQPNSVGKDLDIFAIGAVSLNHTYTNQPKIIKNIFHIPNVLCYVVLSYVLVSFLHLCLGI
jgi:hypothetical protein